MNKTKQEWVSILEHSYGMQQEIDGCPPENRLQYVAPYIFDFWTYDSEKDEQFAAFALETAEAITNGETFAYIADPNKYGWYLMMCHLPFFADRIEWGGSIRGAWWDRQINFRSTGIWDGDEQLYEEMTFTTQAWEYFISAVIEFVRADPENKKGDQA